MIHDLELRDAAPVHHPVGRPVARCKWPQRPPRLWSSQRLAKSECPTKVFGSSGLRWSEAGIRCKEICANERQ